MKNTDFVARLQHLLGRVTYYDNSFPGNCGEINPDGSISFDCIGLVKSVINEPDIVYKTAPAGYYVTPGQVIPDTTEFGILQLCSDVVWGSFQNMTPGEYLYMGGHGGVYAGEYGDVNVIECTGAFGGGVVVSYVDAYGNRFDRRGGYCVGRWEAHGKLSRYIDYSVGHPGVWIEWRNGAWWACRDGKIDHSYNEIAQNENGWWKCKDGKVDFTYTGVAKNENGWWFCRNGQVDFGCNSVEQNENGWWKIVNGKVDFGFTGLAPNAGGWWYLKDGKVDFSKNGIVESENGWWKVTNGKVDFSYNGLAQNEHGYWTLQGGKVDFDYNGLCVNEAGIWVIKNGNVDFTYNGDYQFSGKTYKVKNGKVQ